MRAGKGMRGLAVSLAALGLLVAGGAHATPVVVEAGWQLVRTVSFQDPNAAHYNPIDGKIYVNKVALDSSGGGVYRIEDDGSATLLASQSRPRGLLIDHATGDLYYSVARAEGIYRIPYGTTTVQNWVTGFASGDDDPIGMAFVPDGWVGTIMIPDGMGGETLLAPGMALVVDEGNGNPDRIWSWFLGTPEGEQIVYASSGVVGAIVDVTFTATDAFVADLAGFVFRIQADGSLTVLPTSSPLSAPSGIAADPLTGQLYVLDSGTDQLLRIDTATGQVTVVIENFTVGDNITDTAGLDVSPDGTTLFVSDRGSDEIYVFSLVPEPGAALLLAAGVAGLAWFDRRRLA